MLWWSVDTFKNFDPECQIILAVHPFYLQNWDSEFGAEEKERSLELIKIEGGNSRIQSVKNCLSYLRKNEKSFDLKNAKIFIHDAARPFVSEGIIRRGIDEVSRGVGAVPAVPVSDSLRLINNEGSVAVDRSKYVAVQTPQIFLYEDIAGAYDNVISEEALTDDASVAEKFGIKIKIFEGDTSNKKITNPEDLNII